MLAKFTKVTCLVLGLTVGFGAAAQAGQPPHHHSHGHTHDGYGIPGGNRPVPHHANYGARPPVWHNTTHLDYHPGGYVPRRNHYHYVPGHYDLHRSGHWDR